jgi:hypothetical protein
VPELALQTWVGTPKQACTQESEKKGGDAHLVRFKVGLWKMRRTADPATLIAPFLSVEFLACQIRHSSSGSLVKGTKRLIKSLLFTFFET